MLRLTLFIITSFAFAGLNVQSQVPNLGDRITECANGFIGTPYDPNPTGEYVSRRTIVYDDKIDCMYFVFRCTEIALANGDVDAATNIALNMRFKTKGIIDENNKVLNYEDRFDYADDMILSDKWGKDVTNILGKVSKITTPRENKTFTYVKINDADITKLKSGDIIFFVKPVNSRLHNEIIGHLGLIQAENNIVWLTHAHGSKHPNTNGKVKKIDLKQYLSKTEFIGIIVKRME